MAVRVNHGSNRGLGRQLRRKRVWAREFHTASFTGITVKNLCEDFCSRYGTNSLPPGVTVGAIRFDLRMSGTYPSSLQGGVTVGIVVDAIADPPDNARVSRPRSNPHADWMYFRTFWDPEYFTGTTDRFDVVNTSWNYPDGEVVRAKRKCEEIGESLFFVTEATDPAATYDYALQCSTLLILP